MRNRLTLLFAAIAFVAIAVIYAYVSPTLGSSLRTQKLHSLAAAANAYSRPLAADIQRAGDSAQLAAHVRHAAAASSYRVTLLGPPGPTDSQQIIYDSLSELKGAGNDELSFPIASRAANRHRELTAVQVAGGRPVGQAAKPLFDSGHVVAVAVFSGSLADVQRSVSQIRQRILIAGAIALIVALLAGYLVARALSRRVARLERTAQRVAAGDFSARFQIDSEDELGQLAGALDSMRHQLAELDSARERFIATASHELRTPIFSLGGFLELIEDEELDETTRQQFIGQVRSQVDRLGKLATGLLDLSRLEAGGLQLHIERAEIGEIVRQVSTEFLPALGGHSSTLRTRIGHEPTVAVCDPERVAQILRILIDNAITHTPEGTNMIVSAIADGTTMRLSVRDFGPGIDPVAIARVFEPFFTSDGVQGSGLGLAIAHELAERMDGRLTVHSTPGRTVFTLMLPC